MGCWQGDGSMIVAGLLAGALVGLAVWLLGRPRLRISGDGFVAGGEAPVEAPAEIGWLLRLRIPLCLLAFIAGWAFLGGIVGVLAGCGASVLSWRVLGRAESPSHRRRRELLEAELPWAVQLLAGCVAAGGAVGPALQVVADAMPGPLGDELGRLHHRLALGVDPVLVWRELSTHEQLGALGRSLVRAHESGTPVVASVQALAEDLRARRHTRVEERARSVDVKASAPLGVCFLPAFLLLGVVPMVVGIFSTMHLFE